MLIILLIDQANNVATIAVVCILNDCLNFLFDDLAKLGSPLFFDPRSGLKDNEFSGATFVALCEKFSAIFNSLRLPPNTPVVIPMRIGVESSALFLGALLSRLFPILIKPSMPDMVIFETIQRAGGGIVLISTSKVSSFIQHGFIELSTKVVSYTVLLAPAAMQKLPKVSMGGLIGITSSGTTGRPKVIVHSLDNLLLNARMHVASIGLTTKDVVGLSLPLNFSAGLVAGLLGTLVSGARGVFVDGQRINSRRFLEDYPVTVCMATPSSIFSAFGARVLAKIRLLTVGGDVLHVQLAKRLVEEMVTAGEVYSTYGMTEAGPRIATSRLTSDILDHFAAVPLGQALDGVECDLLGTAANPDVGELMVRTPTVMRGYLNDAEATAEVLDPTTGTLRTGDMFRISEGAMFFVGRIKRVIVRAGENIYPAYVESKILGLHDIQDVWVTGEFHHEFGEVPKAYLLADAPVDFIRLSRDLRKHLPLSHIPASWEIVSKLPDGARK